LGEPAQRRILRRGEDEDDRGQGQPPRSAEPEEPEDERDADNYREDARQERLPA
jgi:hypothetical protein